MAQDPQQQLTDALTRAVADFGIRGASDPARLRAALVDLLGADAHALRSEVDAVVLACTLDVPEALRANPPVEGPVLVDRLTERDVSPELATVAVAAWAGALAPFMSATINLLEPPTVVPVIAPTIVPLPASSDANLTATTVLPASELVPVANHRSRRLAVAAAVVVAVLLVGAIAVWAGTSSGGDGKVATSTSTTGLPVVSAASTPTTHTTTPTTRHKKKKKAKPPKTVPSTAPTTSPPVYVPPVYVPPVYVPPSTQAPVVTQAPETIPPTTPVVKKDKKPVPKVVPTKKTTPTPAPRPTTASSPTAVDLYETYNQCWTGAAWTSQYLGVTRDLPAGWTWVTYPTTGGNPASYGTVAYDSSAPDYWYQPYSNYSGHFSDQFWYAYRDSAGQWSNWALVHIDVQALYAC